MIKKYNYWYDNLLPSKKLIVSFGINFLYWLIAWLIAEQFVFEEERSWSYHIFHAIWMAFTWTLIFKWKTVKETFKRQSQENAISQEDF